MGEWPEDLEIPAQVLVNDNPEASEIAARDEFNRQNPPIRGLAVPDDLRTIELVKRPWRNNKGLWFELAENRVLSAHLAELAPGGNSVRHRHTTEAVHLHRPGHRLHDPQLRGTARGADRLAGGVAVLASRVGVAPALQREPGRDRRATWRSRTPA